MFSTRNIFYGYLRLAGAVSKAQGFKLARPVLKGNVLDIGCGDGSMAAFVNPQRYTGVDIIASQLKKAGDSFPSHKFHLLDCTDQKILFATFNRHQFDTILLLTVLEFIPDPKSLLKNLSELLTEDGRIIITTPSFIIGKFHGAIYHKAKNKLTAVSYFNKNSLTGLFGDLYTIETFKRYNLGLSYFVVAHLNSSNVIKANG